MNRSSVMTRESPSSTAITSNGEDAVPRAELGVTRHGCAPLHMCGLIYERCTTKDIEAVQLPYPMEIAILLPGQSTEKNQLY